MKLFLFKTYAHKTQKSSIVCSRLAKNNSYTKHLLHLFIQFQSLETAEQQRFEEHVVILVISDVRAPALSLQQLVSLKTR